MKLTNSFLCISCEEVFDQQKEGCPKCGSKNYYPIVKWLGSLNSAAKAYKFYGRINFERMVEE